MKLVEQIMAIIRALFWATVVLVAVLSLWPGHAHPPTSPWSDKVGHGLAYLVLGMQWGLGWWASMRIWWLGFGVLWLYSGLLEVMQSLPMIARTTSWLDFIANGVGLGLALGISFLLRFYLRRKYPSALSKRSE